MENDNVIIKALRSGFEAKDKQGKKYYFSIYVVLPGDDNKKGLPMIEFAQGVDEFDSAIEKALSFNPEKIIVVDHKSKTETRRSSNEHPIVLIKSKEEDKGSELQGIIEEKLQNGLEQIKERISSNEESSSGLGLITEQFKHEGEKLRLETQRQIADMRHQKEVEDLQRRIAELEEQHSDDENYIGELEAANTDWEKTYEELKNNRLKFNGVDGKELIGELIGRGLSGFVKQNIGAVAKLSGMPPEVLSEALASEQASGMGGKSQIIEEDADPQMEALIQQIRAIINSLEPEYQDLFIQIIGAIASNHDIIADLITHIS